VTGVYAARAVAEMPESHPVWDWAYAHLVCKLVGEVVPAVQAEPPVPTAINRREPGPALVGFPDFGLSAKCDLQDFVNGSHHHTTAKTVIPPTIQLIRAVPSAA